MIQEILEEYLTTRGATEVGVRYTDGFTQRVEAGTSLWILELVDTDTYDAQPVTTFEFKHWLNDSDIALQDCLNMVNDLDGNSLWNSKGGIAVCHLVSYPQRLTAEDETVAGYTFSMSFKAKTVTF